MAKEHIGLIRRMMRSLKLPEDVDLSVPRCTLIGRRDLLVENHKGILAYTAESVRLQSAEGELVVSGGALVLTEFSGERALIVGRIDAVVFEGQL